MDSEDRNGRNKNLGTYLGLTYGNGSSQHGFLSELTDMTGSSGHFDTKPQVIEGKKSTYPFVIRPEVVGESESGQPLETQIAVSDGSHSTSSMEEHLQVDTERSLRSFTQPASKGDEINVSNSNSSKSKDPDEWPPGPTSVSQVSLVTHESMMHDMPQTQSPPIQVMDRSGEHDPFRIPSSVFERSKSSTQGDWSGASNESLFSIPIGNKSLSRDHFKSGELPKSDVFITFNPSLAIPEMRTDKDGAEFDMSGASVQSISHVMREATVDWSQTEAPAANVLLNPSQILDNSNDSTQSFTFSIKKRKKKKKKCACVPFCCCRKKCRGKQCAWPTCCCFTSSCTFCHCSLPNFYFRWPSCNCYDWSCTFCYCWNCSLKRWCCHSSTILPDCTKSISVKPEVHENQQQPQKSRLSEVSSKWSPFCCWFSSFSCHPHCCSCHCCRRCCCC